MERRKGRCEIECEITAHAVNLVFNKEKNAARELGEHLLTEFEGKYEVNLLTFKSMNETVNCALLLRTHINSLPYLGFNSIIF